MKLNFYWLRQFSFQSQIKGTRAFPVIALMISCMMVTNAFSQDNSQEPKQTVKGKVTDNAGKPLQDVTVKIKGTNKGVVTNESGEYKIELPKNGKKALEFSYVGMDGQEVVIGSQGEVNIFLTPSTTSEQEVVVVG